MASCTIVCHCQCASVGGGRFGLATGRSRVCHHLQASGTMVPAVSTRAAQRRERTQSRLAANSCSPGSRFFFFPAVRFFIDFHRRSVEVACPVCRSWDGVASRAIKHQDPVSRTGFIAVRSLGALQQQFTASCRIRQAWMSFLQDQGAHSSQCECTLIVESLGRRGRPEKTEASGNPRGHSDVGCPSSYWLIAGY